MFSIGLLINYALLVAFILLLVLCVLSVRETLNPSDYTANSNGFPYSHLIVGFATAAVFLIAISALSGRTLTAWIYGIVFVVGAILFIFTSLCATGANTDI